MGGRVIRFVVVSWQKKDIAGVNKTRKTRSDKSFGRIEIDDARVCSKFFSLDDACARARKYPAAKLPFDTLSDYTVRSLHNGTERNGTERDGTGRNGTLHKCSDDRFSGKNYASYVVVPVINTGEMLRSTA